jgi:capsule polysaccharide export protein KpsE/RkpR
MEEYLAFRKEVRSSTSYNTLATVNEQVDQIGRELKQQQEKMHSFQMSNNVVFLQEQGAGAGTYLGKISRSLTSLKMEYKLLQMLTPEQLKDFEQFQARQRKMQITGMKMAGQMFAPKSQ